MARRGAALDGIIKLLAAGAAGARALAGGWGSAHGNFRLRATSAARNADA